MTEWKNRYFTCTKLLKVIDWGTKAVSTLQSGKHKELYDPFPSFSLLVFQLLCLFIAGAFALLRQRICTCGVGLVLQWHLKPKFKVLLKGMFPHKEEFSQGNVKASLHETNWLQQCHWHPTLFTYVNLR